MSTVGGPTFCFAVVSSPVHEPDDLEAAVASVLRQSDLVTRAGGQVLAAFQGDTAAARAGIVRLQAVVGPEVVIDLRPADDPQLAALPLPADTSWPAGRPRIPSSTDPGQGAVAVVVDDSDLVRGMLADLLRVGGWEAYTTGSSSEAVVLCRDRRADVLIADYFLGGVTTGADAIRNCRLSGLDIPSVFFTGGVHGEVANEAGYLGVPVVSKTDVAGLRSFLDGVAAQLRRLHRRR